MLRSAIVEPGHRLSTALLFLYALWSWMASPASVLAAESAIGVPLIIGNRTIHVFRAPLGMFSAAERVESARARIERAFEVPGEGWTSVKSTADGVEVALAARLNAVSSVPLGKRTADILSTVLSRLMILLTWPLGIFLVFVYLTYTLSLFVLTRPASESLSQSVEDLIWHALGAVAGSLPGMFVAVVIFLVAWVATRISTELFDRVEADPAEGAVVNTHTAPATRARVASDLNAAIQDGFNKYGVPIMSPHYNADPSAPKLVPERDWYLPPAEK